jgi:glyoxalase family protein
MTFFPWPSAARGWRGNGEVGAVAYGIRAESAEFWQQRLLDHNVQVGVMQSRFGKSVIPFLDPDGMPLELIVSDEPATIRHWGEGSVAAEHALRGFHGVTLWVENEAESARLLTAVLGFQFVGQEGNRLRYRGAAEGIGLFVDLLVREKQPRGRMGAGSVHHVAFRTRDDEEQFAYQQRIGRAGVPVTEVKDRQYFHSIYFREPSGVLFEVATDAPGFAIDEPLQSLGQSLRLPPWLEPHRTTIENALPPLTYPGAVKASSETTPRTA